MQTQDHPHTNQLIHETSPYLLQHAHNPVNWQPWGEKALRQAEKEDKLIIVSIGYAACHWCHVMEHESFEDPEVAEIMNDHFVSIKVDREERPDVDDIYMTACNLISGRGGWPLNAFALPDGRPVWAGTYFPKEQWINILKQFIELKKNNRDKLMESAEKITSGLNNIDNIPLVAGEKQFRENEIQAISRKFIAQIDMEYGGRKGAPKFPMPNNYEYLLKYHAITGDKEALDAVRFTLNEMSRGGIFDHVGGGFARYSVDDRWKVPHFEKMLYDNAQLVSLYADMYRFTKDPSYENVIRKCLEFIDREMTSDEKGFYSSLDADSEGEEGKYYVWTKNELNSILKDVNQKEAILDYFNIEEQGNWEEEKNILHITQTRNEILDRYKLSENEFQSILKEVLNTLLDERGKRVRPGLDDKILTSWNALMVKGYVDAYIALSDNQYLAAAIKNADFLLMNQKQNDHRLNRNYKDGKSRINAFLDDYALLIQALVALYEVTFDEKWLYEANHLAEYTLNHFYNEENSMFYYTSDLDPPLVARKMEMNDNVIPASNSIMARNLHVLGELLYNREYSDIALQMLQNMKQSIINVGEPSFYSNWCQLYLDLVYAPFEIAIVGEKSDLLRDQMISHYLPSSLFLGGANEGTLPLLKGKLDNESTYIYVCRNKVCKFPVETVEEALELVEKSRESRVKSRE